MGLNGDFRPRGGRPRDQADDEREERVAHGDLLPDAMATSFRTQSI